jgi:Zn-finger nucleic acid-binding protein/catechol 2,3-dioxygenase-like lactoylglutathione lyase family enzyme
MLSTARVVPFLATSDGARARAFYEGVLGLRVVSDDDFALVVETGGAEIRIAKVGEKDKVTAPYTVLGWEVGDVRATVGDLGARGVKLARYEFLKQDDAGIWTAPGGAKVAWFQDPDGNVLSVAQPPGSATTGAGAAAGPGSTACPRCEKQLVWMTTTQFGALVCPKCHGMWVERNTWDAVVRLTEQMGRSELARPGASDSAKKAEAQDVACLVCGTRCLRILSWAGGVEVDVCSPHGLWFDRDELQTILDDVARCAQQARAGVSPVQTWDTQAKDVGVGEGLVEVGRGGGEPSAAPPSAKADATKTDAPAADKPPPSAKPASSDASGKSDEMG